MIKGLWNYAVKTLDLEGTTAFYLNTLGGTLIRSGKVLGCSYRLLRLGNTRVILFEKAPYEDLLKTELPCGFLHAVYEVADHDQLVGQLRRAGARFILEPTVIDTDWDVRKIAFFESPEGVRTEIMQVLRTIEPV